MRIPTAFFEHFLAAVSATRGVLGSRPCVHSGPGYAGMCSVDMAFPEIQGAFLEIFGFGSLCFSNCLPVLQASEVVGMAVALTMPLPTPMSRGVDFLQDCCLIWFLCAFAEEEDQPFQSSQETCQYQPLLVLLLPPSTA